MSGSNVAAGDTGEAQAGGQAAPYDPLLGVLESELHRRTKRCPDCHDGRVLMDDVPDYVSVRNPDAFKVACPTCGGTNRVPYLDGQPAARGDQNREVGG